MKQLPTKSWSIRVATSVLSLASLTSLVPGALAQEPPAPKPDTAALRAKYAAAQQKHVEGAIETARKEMQEVLDADPKNGELALAIATWLCTQRQDFVGGAPFARRAAELAPDSAEAMNLFGATLNATGSFTEAEALYRAAAAKFPNDGTMLYGLGMAHAQQHKYLEAQEAYSKALVLEPQNGLYHFSLGENFANLRCYDDAEKQLELAVKLKGHADAAWKLGEVLARAGKDEEAERTLRQALNQGPTSARWNAGFQLGVFYFERGRHSEAAALLHKAIEVKPDSRDGWIYLARAQKALGKNEASARSLKRYQELRAKADRSEEEHLLDLIRAQLDGRSDAAKPPTEKKSDGG